MSHSSGPQFSLTETVEFIRSIPSGLTFFDCLVNVVLDWQILNPHWIRVEGRIIQPGPSFSLGRFPMTVLINSEQTCSMDSSLKHIVSIIQTSLLI